MSLAVRTSFLRRVSVLSTRSAVSSVRAYSEAPDRDKPVKFTTSEAANWRAEYTRSGNIYDDSPDAQPFIVSLSTAVFLWYFLWYREESDIDRRFDFTDASLYEKVPDMEEVRLNVLREAKLKKGENVGEIDARLKELEGVRLGKV